MEWSDNYTSVKHTGHVSCERYKIFYTLYSTVMFQPGSYTFIMHLTIDNDHTHYRITEILGFLKHLKIFLQSNSIKGWIMFPSWFTPPPYTCCAYILYLLSGGTSGPSGSLKCKFYFKLMEKKLDWYTRALYIHLNSTCHCTRLVVKNDPVFKSCWLHIIYNYQIRLA